MATPPPATHMRRVNVVSRHLTPAFAAAAENRECFIVWAKRTPLTRARKGGFRESYTEELTATLIKAALDAHPQVPPSAIGDVVLGNVLQIGNGARAARQAQFLAGMPASVPVRTVNRLCSSGLQAVADVQAGILTGMYDIALAGGVETMTHDSFDTFPKRSSPAVAENVLAMNCAMGDGDTSEVVAQKYNVTRAQQDEFAFRSHMRAKAAQEEGLFDEEIVPVQVGDAVVFQDDGIRKDSTLEKMAKLKPAFGPDGRSTGANCSQISDGAALLLLASGDACKKYGLKPIARMRSFAVAGVNPDEMGIGPQFAIPKALEMAGASIDEVDLFEINEAFASQAIHCGRELGISGDKLNVKGGAIALGHPLGCTGARLVTTLLPELKRRNQKLGVVSMCVGTGMGAAAVIERLD